MIAELSIFPVGEGTSLSDSVAEVLAVIHRSGVKYELHSMGTNIEGSLDEVFDIVRQCHTILVEKGCKRISTTIKIDDRRDKVYTMKEKVAVVKKKYR